jgi:ATP-dependent Clp protease ATP-binding subunit ClpA
VNLGWKIRYCGGLLANHTKKECQESCLTSVVTLDLALLLELNTEDSLRTYEGRVNELEKNDDIILFIDEIHTIVGAGGATGSLDASNMFKPF